MPGYTGPGKNVMLNALAAVITHAGLLQEASVLTGVTGVASTDVLTKATHGLADGDLVFVSGLTGGTGLIAGDPLFVRDSTTNTFKLTRTSGGTALDFTTDITVATVTKLTEISGGSPAYARKAIAFNAAGDGTMDDSTNGAAFDIPAGATVSYVGYFTALTAGTLEAIGDIPNESYTGQGTYTLTDADLDLNNS